MNKYDATLRYIVIFQIDIAVDRAQAKNKIGE